MVDIFHPRYTYTKRGVFYLSKTIPLDLRHHYKKSRFIQSLRTKSKGQANRASQVLINKLEDYWLSLRLKEMQIPAAHLLHSVPSQNLDSTLPSIEDAMELYLRVKGENKQKTFFTHTKRSVDYLIQCLGCHSLDQYSSADASKFRDWLRKKGLSTASIQRNFTSIKALVNFTILELGLDCRNAFAGVYLSPDDRHPKRQPLSADQIRRIQTACYELDDEPRWLVALISDTGMRLAEAVGLMTKDIVLDHPYPHLKLKPYPHRSLKTRSSERTVPLVGASLWAAKQILASSDTGYCFPRYSSPTACNSNSASAAINKWIKTIAGDNVVIHGFRHSFRDRLREVEAPSDLIDQLGGWSLQSVGQAYGNGYSLEVLSKWIGRLTTQIHTFT
ncbi:MAG: integrase [Gammaproteobacteria bacterium TMED134]|nr:MAG: integrase [Gammaproteobacteria bacterium TMED134]